MSVFCTEMDSKVLSEYKGENWAESEIVSM